MHASQSVVGVCLFSILSACGGSQPDPQAPSSASSDGEPASALPDVPPLEPARVVVAMRSNEAELRKCFFRAPSASGFVRIGWRVDTAGVVSHPAVKDSTVNNAEVERCLTARVGELRFGEISQAAKAEWTYVYRLAEPMTEKQKKKASKKRKQKEEREEEEPGIVVEPEGSIDPDKVDDVVISGYRLFARCYRDGFDRDTSLEGTIRFRFVVGRDGRVVKILDGASDLPDRRVIDCVAESFYALEFPAPSAQAKVSYRLQLE